MTDAAPIGLRIKRARERMRWTQRQLAQAAGVSPKTIDNYENGRTSPRNSIGALEEILGISLGEPAPEPAELVPTDEWERSVLEDRYLPDDEKRWLITQSREARLAYVAARRARREQDAAAGSARSGHGRTAG